MPKFKLTVAREVEASCPEEARRLADLWPVGEELSVIAEPLSRMLTFHATFEGRMKVVADAAINASSAEEAREIAEGIARRMTCEWRGVSFDQAWVAEVAERPARKED